MSGSKPWESRRLFLAAMGTLPLVAAGRATMVQARPDCPPDSGATGFSPGLIYFNTASAGPTPQAVLDRTLDAWRRLETNPVLMGYGRTPDTVCTAADDVRAGAAALLGCAADEILLTRGTTDGMTILSQSIRLRAGDRILTTDQEHEGGETCWLYRQRRDGIIVDRVTIAPGDHDVDAIVRRFTAALTPATKVISVSHILSSTGLLMPVREIAALARAHGVLCVVDGAQAVGAMPVDVREIGCDAYATSGHKWLMGPKGTGILYIAQAAQDAIAPVQWELGRRYISDSAGLGPMTLAIGLGQAVDICRAANPASVQRHNLILRNRFHAALSNMTPVHLVSPPPGPVATALIAFTLPDELESVAFRMRMHERHNIMVKSAEKRWFNGLRFSPHVFNTEAEVDRAVAALDQELRAA